MTVAAVVALLVCGCGGHADKKAQEKGTFKHAAEKLKMPVKSCHRSSGYRLCEITKGSESSSTIERQVASRWRLVTGIPLPKGDPFGSWYQVWRSPDRKLLLAEWDHPCDSSHAFVVPSTGGRA